MTHSGDDGDFRVVDGPCHPLVVEGPQVLQRAAAAACNEHIAQLPAVGIADGPCDLRRCLHTLHPHRQQQYLSQGVAVAQNPDHVVDRRTGAAGNNGDPLGELRQRLFVGRVEKSLVVELILQLLEGHEQIAHAVGGQAVTVELILAVPGVDADAAAGDDLHAVAGPELQMLGCAPEHDAAQNARFVLQGKVVVAGGVDLVVGQLAPHQDVPQNRLTLDQVLDILVDFTDRINTLVLHAVSSSIKKGRATQCPAFLLYSLTSARTKLPRTPLTKRTTSAASYFLVISTASLMATPLGISGM